MDEYKFADAAGAVLTASEAQLETAQKSLASLNKVISHLDKQSQALPERVKEDIRTVLVGAAEDAIKGISRHFANVNHAAINAAEAYRHAERSVYLRITLLMMALGIIVIGAMTVWMMRMLPNEAKLTVMRLEERELQANIAMLEKRAGKTEIRQCQTANGGTRLCVRIDETAPTYQNGFRIIKGY